MSGRTKPLAMLALAALLLSACGVPAGGQTPTAGQQALSTPPSPGHEEATPTAAQHHHATTPPQAASATPTTAQHRPSATAPAQSAEGRIHWFSGAGETATESVALEPRLLIVHFEHQPATPFALFLMNEAGDHLALLANHTAPARGSRAFGITTEGSYYLHIIAEDSWRAGLEQPGASQLDPARGLPVTLQGDGSLVAGPLSLAHGPLTLHWQHAGPLAFELRLLTTAGAPIATLLESSGPGQGAQSYTLDYHGPALLDIAASGDWSLTLE